ncbi:hypothetical protein GCM10007067_26300 [Lysobacter bugurensis]|uniref:DUF2306 domain-containing protein n=2 Tax=Cognatilysobacter bugurensis TaxID=543356 RepID=A0A918WBB7_9GAMM|nr:hypothetical protein GCM10007067_26300 [Lysobacter bugurensis]
MSGYSLFVALHVGAGVIALVAFWLNAALRKGSRPHRLVGRTYLIAMAAVIVSGAPLLVQRVIDGHPATAAFLGYLLLLTATATWLLWRAVRDRTALHRYTGPVYGGLAITNIAAGLGVLLLGLRVDAPLLIGFSAVGLVTGIDMLRKRARLAAQPLWWRSEHTAAVIACGVATHIAFLSLGLPRLLPSVDGAALHYLAWFGPLAVAVVARVLIARRQRRAMLTRTTRPAVVTTAAADVAR